MEVVIFVRQFDNFLKLFFENVSRSLTKRSELTVKEKAQVKTKAQFGVLMQLVQLMELFYPSSQ